MASAKLLPKSTNPNARKPYPLRYWDSKGQHLKCFATARERKDFAVKFEHDSRLSIFVDPRAGTIPFADAARAYITRLAATDGSKANLTSILNAHVAPAFAGRTLAQVAADREGVQDLLLVTMPGKVGASRVAVARTLITSVVGEAVKAGKLPANHRLAGIDIPTPRRNTESFTFATHAQTAAIAAGLPAGLALSVWIMRGCGLRISEALAVNLRNFRDDGRTLRVSEQVSTDGTVLRPLKHRTAGQFRDIPCPRWLWDMVSKHVANYGTSADGYLFPGRRTKRFVAYHSYRPAFQRHATAAGLPSGYAPHQMRHSYASAMLAASVPITDVSRWLGHRDINVTYATYSHLVPDAVDRGRAAIEADFESWSKAA